MRNAKLNLPVTSVTLYQKKKAFIEQDVRPYFDFLNRSGRVLLWVEIDQVKHDPKSCFEKYACVDTEQVTCLVPLIDCVAPKSEAQFIYELIPELSEKGRINEIFQLNGDHLLDSKGNFSLREYSKSDIFDHVQELKSKHVIR